MFIFMLLLTELNIRRSSNGRTAGSGPVNRGSSPCLRASKKNKPKGLFFLLLARRDRDSNQ